MLACVLLVLAMSQQASAPPFPLPEGARLEAIHGSAYRLHSKERPGEAAAQLAGALGREGWTVLFRDAAGSLVAQKSRPWGETRLEAKPDGGGLLVTTTDRSVDEQDLNPHQTGEIALLAQRLAAALGLLEPDPPLARPASHEDFPFLGHLPGLEIQPQLERSTASQFTAERSATEGGIERIAVPGPVITKSYRVSPPLRTLQLFFAYYRAMPAAGWTLVESNPGDRTGRPHLVMTKTMSGVPVWVRIDIAGSSMEVATATGEARRID